MNLSELEPVFVIASVNAGQEATHYNNLHEDDITRAQGVRFLCPKCYEARGFKSEGVHYVFCWFAGRGVSEFMPPRSRRWSPFGRGLLDLTLKGIVSLPKTAAVNEPVPCGWEGYVAAGIVVSLS